MCHEDSLNFQQGIDAKIVGMVWYGRVLTPHSTHGDEEKIRRKLYELVS